MVVQRLVPTDSAGMLPVGRAAGPCSALVPLAGLRDLRRHRGTRWWPRRLVMRALPVVRPSFRFDLLIRPAYSSLCRVWAVAP